MRIGLLGNETGLVRRIIECGVEVAIHLDDDAGSVPSDARIMRVQTHEQLAAQLEHPRLFVLDLPVGRAIDRVIDEAYVVMEPGDVVIDPTASYWCDTVRRYRRMRHRSLFYVDAALLEGVRPPGVLVAGDESGVTLASQLLTCLASPNDMMRAGASGAAHFALSVRAGVATAVAHAFSEARQLLEAYPNKPEAASVAARLWPPSPPAGLAAAWLLDDAVRLHASIPLIAHSLMLELGAALDEHRAAEIPPRVGGFAHPDDVL